MRNWGLICLAVLILICAECSRRENSEASPLSRPEFQTIASARKISDLFDDVNSVHLELSAESAIASITDLDVDAKGNLIIADGWQLRQVYVFSATGKFKQLLGRRGQGPGEYSTPVSVAVNSGNEILLSDFLRNQIIIYDSDYRYRDTILGKPRIYYFLHINSKNEIFMYSGTVRPGHRDTFDTIHKLDKEGGTVFSFAPIPQPVLNMGFSAVADGMAIDKDDFIYEMNPLYYEVRKYAADGRWIRSFTNPHFDRSNKKSGSPLIFNGPYYLDLGLLVIQREDRLDLFDTEGHFIIGDIALSMRILHACGDILYLEGSGEAASGNLQPNPEIYCYRLRPFAK